MTAFALPVVLFLLYLILGLGTTAILPLSFPAARRLRLAPGIGIGLFLIPAIALSRWGIPVRAFVFPLTATLLTLSIIAIAIRPPRIDWRDAALIAGPLLIGLVLVGSPLATFGFHWLSYSNNDMTNYALGAQRFVESGYFTSPPASAMIGNRDTAQLYWVFAAVDGERSGVEILLASVASSLHRNPFEVFMPLIVSAFLVIVSAAGALAPSKAGRGVPAVISCMVAASPLAGFGAFYQLLAQEFGLATACTVVSLMIPATAYRAWRDITSYSVVTGVAACGLLAVYPEIAPFVGLGLFIYVATRVRGADLRKLGTYAAGSALAVLVLLNSQALLMLGLIYIRITSDTRADAAHGTLFPYYLLPSGLANLWGLQPIATFYQDPLQSMLIAIAALLTAIILAMAIALLLRTDAPAAPVLLAMAAFAIFAASRREGFALYKLAMYVQPFLLASLISGLVLLSRRWPAASARMRRSAIALPVVCLLLAGLVTSQTYFDASADQITFSRAGFDEIPFASRDGLLPQLSKQSRATKNRLLVTDTSNDSLAKIEAGYFRDDALFSLGNDYFVTVIGGGRSVLHGPVARARRKRLMAFLAVREANMRQLRFTFDRRRAESVADFLIDERAIKALRGASSMIVATTARQTVVNRATLAASNADIEVLQAKSAQDFLTFVPTTLGGSVSSFVPRERVALFQLEPDYFFPGATMAAAGRYLLFAVHNAHSPVRLVLDLTASLDADGVDRLPPVHAVGTQRVTFHAIGRGAGRLISDPVRPVTIDGEPYIGIDMGTTGHYFPQHRTGLMNLYGGDVLSDSRRIVGFARAISILSGKGALVGAPHSIARFPTDLENPHLFYSGIYEDGWTSEDMRARLDSTGTRGQLTIKFTVPMIGDPEFSPSLTVSMDGREIGVWPAPLGSSTINVPLLSSPGIHTVQLHFSKFQRLPGGDGRPISARIDYLGFP